MLQTPITATRVFRHGHLACGIGAGAKGFNMANPRVGNIQARFECAGGIDVDPGAIANFETMTGVKGTVMDLFSREQYRAFHGRDPGPAWREAVPDDLREVFGRLDCLFASFPCKGFSSLLPQSASLTDKYQALNALTLRGIWLALEAYRDRSRRSSSRTCRASPPAAAGCSTRSARCCGRSAMAWSRTQ